jgi:uncharacterized protein (DUF433 family)
MDWRERIVFDPAICHGKPTVKGTRVLVSVVLSHLARGDRVETIIDQFPSLTKEDVDAVAASAALAEQSSEREPQRVYDDEGVDLTLIRRSLAMTALERLRLAEGWARAILRARIVRE